MSDYILTSSGELYHWGIKGQRWGIRRYQNRDGSLTADGRKRYADRISKVDRKDKNKTVDEAKKSDEVKKLFKNNPDIVAAKNKLLDADTLSEEFLNDESLQLKYKRIAAKAYNKKWDWGFSDEEIDSDEYWIWDDWDQGEGNSFEWFLKDRGVDPKDYGKKLYEAEKEYESACEKAVTQWLGEYGDIQLRELYKGYERRLSTVTEKALADLMDDEQTKRHMYGRYMV